jgi:A/G-specific adenine glycosylase
VLVVRDEAGRVLLERRAEHGVWGGLYSFPELAAEERADEWCRRRLGADVEAHDALPAVAHAFTHFDLRIDPVAVRLARGPRGVEDGARWLWHDVATPLPGGIPAPIAKILRSTA